MEDAESDASERDGMGGGGGGGGGGAVAAPGAVGASERASSDSSDSEGVTGPVGLGSENNRDMDVILPRRKRFIPKYEVEGVSKVTLSEETQILIELCIGPDVNSQHPWKSVKKSLILESIEIGAELSEFFPFKEQLETYDEEKILMGYIIDESKDSDDFYICFTKAARDHCKQQSDKFHRRQQTKLDKAVNKKPRPWKSLGSEVEIIELVPVNTRPLIEIEIKSRFPTAYQPEKFVPRDSQNVRDGYLELTPYRVKYNNIFKKRVDTATQVAPPRVNSEAQTELRYPRDMWTQSIADALGNVADDAEKTEGAGGEGEENVADKSENSDDSNSEVEEEKNDVSMEAYKNALKKMKRASYIKRVNNFMASRRDDMDTIVELNSVMDMYSNDYPKLVKKDVFGMYDTMKFDDYVCFTDVRAKDKYVSSAAFHPMWTGVVAIAYADGSPSVLKSPGNRQDPIQRAVYGLNPVMLWSHIDSLLPKLYLESPREVKVLSFCPFNENILIGGCVNGQIVIWDITKKLEKAEEIEVLSETREKYRIAINSQMGWMKNVQDKSIVNSTALSLLLHSHYGPVTAIKWISPNFTVSNTGRKKLLENDQPRSLIFFTSSEDGSIRMWNLSLENVTSIEGKKVKRSKRVPRRPSALTLDVSPLKILDRTLQPIFKIVIGAAGVPETVAAQTFSMVEPPVEYIHIVKATGSGRKYFTCKILDETEDENSQTMYSGSMYGDLIKLAWEGHDFNTGEVINSEYCTFKYRCLIHDGIVTTTSPNPFMDSLILTVGGKIFAIWSNEISERPLMWKKRRCRLTDAAWSRYKPSLLFVTTSEGTLESWDLLLRSDEPIAVQTLSGGMITGVTIHTLPLAQNIIGVSDVSGSFRMFLNPPIFMLESPSYLIRMKSLIERETTVQLAFRKWQSAWTAQNTHIIDAIRRKEVALQIEKDEKRRKELEEEERIKEEEAELERLQKLRVITPEERWRGLINKLIEKTIAVKKRINRVELLQQERPLRELEAQRLEKERKMLEIMKNQKHIFNETVAILFPEAVETKKITPSALLPSAERARLKKMYLEDYDILVRAATKTVKENEYKYEFQWQSTLSEGLERRQALNVHCSYIQRHKERLERETRGYGPVAKPSPARFIKENELTKSRESITM